MKTADRGRADGDMGEASDMSKDLVENCVGSPPYVGGVVVLDS